MHKRLAAYALIMALLPSSAALAGIYTDDLTKCLVKSSSPSDQTAFDVWLFSAMISHSSLRPYANISEGQREQASKAVAALLVRLVTTDCRQESVAAVRNEGASSFVAAFSVLGQVAVQQMMNDAEVSRTMSAMDKYLDRAKLNDVLKEAGVSPQVIAPLNPETPVDAASKLAISKISNKDWSIEDADELLGRVMMSASTQGIQSLAASGDAKAKTLLGIGLLTGSVGFPRDEAGAAKEFDLAARQGFPDAQVMLGFMYQFGLGDLPRDEGKAAELYREAADRGDAGGQMCLGDMYLAGKGGLPKDRARAVQLYRASAHQGDKQAEDKLVSLREQP